MVVLVHRGVNDTRLDRVHGEGPIEFSGVNDARGVQGFELNRPRHVAVGEGNGFREIPIGTGELRGVADLYTVTVEGQASVTVDKAVVGGHVLKAHLHGDVHRFAASKVLTVAGHRDAVFGEDHGLQFQVVFVALVHRGAPGVGEGNGNHAVLQHRTGGGGELHLIVPSGAKTEGDVRDDAVAILADGDGVAWVQLHQ